MFVLPPGDDHLPSEGRSQSRVMTLAFQSFVITRFQRQSFLCNNSAHAPARVPLRMNIYNAGSLLPSGQTIWTSSICISKDFWKRHFKGTSSGIPFVFWAGPDPHSPPSLARSEINKRFTRGRPDVSLRREEGGVMDYLLCTQSVTQIDPLSQGEEDNDFMHESLDQC